MEYRQEYKEYAYMAASWTPFLVVMALIFWGWANERRRRRSTNDRVRSPMS